MRKIKEKIILRIDDLRATSRCLGAIMNATEDAFAKLTYTMVIENINELIQKIDSGEVKTKEDK